MLTCVFVDENKFDCMPDWIVGNQYKLTIIKPIRHTDRFKALLDSEFGEVRVHCNKGGVLFVMDEVRFKLTKEDMEG
jgi:hypothetical protein